MSSIKAGPQTLIFDGNVPPIHAPSMHENAFGPVFLTNIDGGTSYLLAYIQWEDPYDTITGPQRWVARVVTIDPVALTLTSGPELIGADGTNPLGIVPFTAGKAVIVYTTPTAGIAMQMLHVSGNTLTVAGDEFDLGAAITAVWPLAHIPIDVATPNYVLESDAPYGVYFNYLPFGSEPDNYMYHLYITQVGSGDDLTLFQQERTVDFPDMPVVPRLVGSGDRRVLTYIGQPPSGGSRVLKYVTVGLWRPDDHNLEVGTPVVFMSDPDGAPFWAQWMVYDSASGPIAVLVKITGFSPIGDVLTEYSIAVPIGIGAGMGLRPLNVVPRVGDQTDYFPVYGNMFAPIDCGLLMSKVVGHEDDPVHGKDVADREYSILDASQQPGAVLSRTVLLNDRTTSPYGFARPPGAVAIDWYASASNGHDQVLVVTADIHFETPIADHAYFSITGQVLNASCAPPAPVLTLGDHRNRVAVRRAR